MNNRLNLVASLVGPGGTNANESYFEYDGFGRLRRERTLNPVENPQQGQQRSESVRQFAQGLTLREEAVQGYDATNQVWNVVSTNTIVDRIDGTAGYYTSGLWHFTITDQLGTPRVIFNQNGIVVERNHYYAYGLRHPTWSSSQAGTSQQDGYAGGQRLRDELAVES